MAEDGKCCPPGSWPALVAPADYTPKGQDEALSDLPLYVSGNPDTARAAVIVFPEVFGFEGRLKGICDSFAAENYFVVMPDCHRGDTAKGKDSVVEWVKSCEEKHPVISDVQKVIDYIVSKNAAFATDKKIGSVGHCWGGWAFCRASAAGLPLKCGVSPHPSIKLEEFSFGASQAELCMKVTMPVRLICAGNDPENVKPGGELVKIFAEKQGDAFEFPDMAHGWFSRGDLGEPLVKRDTEATLKLILEFLEQHLK